METTGPTVAPHPPVAAASPAGLIRPDGLTGVASPRRAPLAPPRPDVERALDVLALSAAVIALVILLAALKAGALIAIPTVLAALVAVGLAPVARWMERRGVPRGLSAGVLVFGSVAALGSLLYWLAPSAEALTRELPGVARRIEALARELEADVAALGGEVVVVVEEPVREVFPTGPVGNAEPEPAEDEDEEADPIVASGRRLLTDSALAAPAMLGAFAYGVFLAFFLLSDRARVARSVMTLARTRDTRMALMRAMRDVRLQVSTYLLTVTLINIGFGVAAGGALFALGTPNAAAWGVAVALMNYMPYIGIALVNLALLATGMATHGDLQLALTPVAALFVMNIIEGNVVTPALVGRRVEASALAVFLAIAFGAWLWGAAGAIIATPALIFLRAFALRLIGDRWTPRAAAR